jgi:enoyl-CoA hydratase/carnithine racemase
MTWAMYEQLGAICERLAGDSDVRVVCLRGAGGEAFVAGTDIEQFKAFKDGTAGVAYEHRRAGR